MKERIDHYRRAARRDRVLAGFTGASAVVGMWLAFSGEPVIGVLGFCTCLVFTYRMLQIANAAADKADRLAGRDRQLRRLKGEAQPRTVHRG